MFGFGNVTGTRRPAGNRAGNSMLRTAALAGLGMMAYRWFKNRQTTTASAGARNTSGPYHDTSEATEPKDVW
jgi:uncharacterized membrane protein YebE (DUF533 family)